MYTDAMVERGMEFYFIWQINNRLISSASNDESDSDQRMKRKVRSSRGKLILNSIIIKFELELIIHFLFQEIYNLSDDN